MENKTDSRMEILFAFIDELQQHGHRIMEVRANRQSFLDHFQEWAHELLTSNGGGARLPPATKDLLLWYLGVFQATKEYGIEQYDALIFYVLFNMPDESLLCAILDELQEQGTIDAEQYTLLLFKLAA